MDQSVTKARRLLQRGLAKQAFDLLRQAADDGAAEAAALLGEMRVSGSAIRRDLGEARAWFDRAAELGLAEAEPVFIALLANGAGDSGRKWSEALTRLKRNAAKDIWAARQSDLLAAMSLTAAGDPQEPPGGEVLNDDPRIESMPGFLTTAECRYLIERSKDFMQASTIVDPRTGALAPNPIRAASAAGFPFIMEDPALHAINRRIAAASGTSYEQGEPTQVLRYRPGEEYKLHSDALPLGVEQRILTFLIALSDDFEGGQTEFPHLGITWRGRPGDALTFANVDSAGQPEQRVWHAGTLVTRGTKYLLSKWIRERPLDLSGPPGRPF